MVTKKNSLAGGLLREQSKMDMMVTKRAKEAPKTSNIIPVSLQVSILETKIPQVEQRQHGYHSGTE